MAVKLSERKKKFEEEAKRRGTGHGTRDDYEKDSYRWCYQESAAPKEVKVMVERVGERFVKTRVTVDGEVTFET